MNWLKKMYRISNQDLEERLKRIERAYRIVEQNEIEQTIVNIDKNAQMFEVRSCKDMEKFYSVDAEISMCTCPDFAFRFLKCKHIIAAEFASRITK
ncbi:MAG TPA: SWIM zinc finger family protein [Nitrososphaera sp.]